MNEIDKFAQLQRLFLIFQRVSQISWTFNQTKRRYPFFDSITAGEIDSLTKFLMDLGFELEEAYKDWKEELKRQNG